MIPESEKKDIRRRAGTDDKILSGKPEERKNCLMRQPELVNSSAAKTLS